MSASSNNTNASTIIENKNMNFLPDITEGQMMKPLNADLYLRV